MGIFLIGLAGCGKLENFFEVSDTYCGPEKSGSFHGQLKFEIRVERAYEGTYDDVWIQFSSLDPLPSQTPGCCPISEYEYLIEINGKTDTISSNYTYNITRFPANERLQFSLEDENNVKRNYDIDLSEIVHSYQVRGDSVDINIRENCLLEFYTHTEPSHWSYYTKPNKSKENIFSFSQFDDFEPFYILDCFWKNGDSTEADTLTTRTAVYWMLSNEYPTFYM